MFLAAVPMLILSFYVLIKKQMPGAPGDLLRIAGRSRLHRAQCLQRWQERPFLRDPDSV